jgi:hypothetical protein
MPSSSWTSTAHLLVPWSFQFVRLPTCDPMNASPLAAGISSKHIHGIVEVLLEHIVVRWLAAGDSEVGRPLSISPRVSTQAMLSGQGWDKSCVEGTSFQPQYLASFQPDRNRSRISRTTVGAEPSFRAQAFTIHHQPSIVGLCSSRPKNEIRVTACGLKSHLFFVSGSQHNSESCSRSRGCTIVSATWQALIIAGM